MFFNKMMQIFVLDLDSFCSKLYLVSLLDLTDLLSSRWVVDGEDLPTHRVVPLIVDENLQTKEKFLESIQKCCKLFCLLFQCEFFARPKHSCVCVWDKLSCKTVLNIYGTFSNQVISAFRFQQHA